MKLMIEIPKDVYNDMIKLVKVDGDIDRLVDVAIANGTPISDNVTNGQVLFKMFPPSVYYGDDEKHIVLLAKDCELTCYNNEWWNAPYKAESEVRNEQMGC